MKKLGMSSSDLARQVWGTTTDKRGYTVARNRDRIGHYLAGTSYPEAENLQRLADALHVPVETLAIERPALADESAPMSAHGSTQAGQQPDPGLLRTTMPRPGADLARFQADRLISQDLAIKLIQLILEDDRKRAILSNNGNGNGNDGDAPEPGTIISGGGERKAS
jgi:transcriptional regulator with XRE-family HTH domain